MTMIDGNGAIHDTRGRFSGHVRSQPDEDGLSTTAARRTLSPTTNGLVDSWLCDLEIPPGEEPTRTQMREFLSAGRAVEVERFGAWSGAYEGTEWAYDAEEATAAAREVSEALADGQPGKLTAADYLWDGDRVDLSRIVTEEQYDEEFAEWARTNYATVTRSCSAGDGMTEITLKDRSETVLVATGTALPVVTVRFRGQERTERSVLIELRKDHGIRTRPVDGLDAAVAAAGLSPDHPDFPEKGLS